MWEQHITETNYRKEIDSLISVLLSNKKGQKTLRLFFAEYSNDKLVCSALLVSMLLKRDNVKGYERKQNLSFYIGYAFVLYKKTFGNTLC